MGRTIIAWAAGAFLLQGCAFPASVQRIGVEYNAAVAGMANEVTLLNIVRAKEDMPLHYTTVGRLSGSMIVSGTAKLDGAVRGSGLTTTTTMPGGPTTAVAPAGTTTTTTSQSVASTVAEGVDVYTPSVSGTITTGPSFDISILDTQKFYQGILAAVPFPTVENYISQGIPDGLLMRLLIERIDYRLSEDAPLAGRKKGDVVKSVLNAPSGPRARDFAQEVECYQLAGRSFRKPPVPLASVSRVVRPDGQGGSGLTVSDLALLDGKSLEVSGPIGTPSGDARTVISRLSAERRVAELTLLRTCGDPVPLAPPPGFIRVMRDPRALPKGPPPQALYLGDSNAMILGADRRSSVPAKVELEITFRSTESLIRFVGRYLEAAERDPANTYALDGAPLFSVSAGTGARDVVRTVLLGRRYAIADDANRRRNMLVIALIEQLVNLQKESADRPVTVPVQVIQ